MTHCNAAEGQCHVCGDVAVRGRVLEIHGDSHTATVAIDGQRALIAIDLVDATVGDELLVHLGFAIERIDSREGVS